MAPTIDESPTILVVDDEETIRSLLATLFTRDGRFKVETAEDGEIALSLLREKNYSLVITDLQMPNMGGLDLLRELRRSHPELPVMVFTGYGDLQDAIDALRLGAMNFLRKPFDLKEIIPSVTKAIEIVRRSQRKKRVFEFMDSLQMDLTVPPRLDHIDPVLQQVVDPLIPMGITSEAEIKNVFLALDEVFNNAIAYGALQVDSSLRDQEDGFIEFERTMESRQFDPAYAERTIHFHADFTKERARFIIKDPGDGFDPTSLPDPTCPENLMREHGRGLLLVQCFMDEIHFNEKGNEVTIIKRRPA